MIPECIKLKKQKWFLSYYLIWTPFIVVYQVTNRYHFIEPKELPMTWMDEAIPFVPWMVPVYVSYLIYTFLVIARSRDNDEVKDIFILTHIQLGLSALFFIFYPITFPRDLFYFTSPFTSAFNNFWLWFDAPANCFPSLHAILCMTAIRHSRHKKYQWIYITWGLAIIVSTLTCKQHYIVDILAGVFLYGLSLKIFQFYCSCIPGKIPSDPPSHNVQKKSSK